MTCVPIFTFQYYQVASVSALSRISVRAASDSTPLQEASYFAQALPVLLGLAALIAVPILAIRTKFQWELDGLRVELSSHDLSDADRHHKEERWWRLQRKLYGRRSGRGNTFGGSMEPPPRPVNRGGKTS